MKNRIELIQLFSDEVFFEELKDQFLKIDDGIVLNHIPASVYFSGMYLIKRDHIFFINLKILDTFPDQLSKLSISNFVVFIFKDEKELIENQNVYFVSDLVLPYHYSEAQLFSTWNISRKNFHYTENEQFEHSFPCKLIDCWTDFLVHSVSDNHTRLFLKNERYQYIGCNHHFAKDFLLPSITDVIGLTDEDLMDEKSAKNLFYFDKQVFDTGENLVGFETEICFKTGIKKQIKTNRYPLKDRSGCIRGIIGIYEILSEYQNEEVTQFSDHKLLQFLMDNIIDTIYFKDTESRFVRINNAQSNLLGVKSPEDAIGKTDFDFFNIEHSKKAFAEEQRIMIDGLPINSLEYVGTKDGKFRWLNSSKVPIFNRNGKVIGTAGITHDVDKMIRVEHRLKAERDLLQLLIDNIPSPIYFKDKESKFTRVNLAQSRLLGANSNEEVLGKTDFDFYSYENASFFYADERVIIEQNKPLINKIEQCKPLGDETRWFSTTKIPITNEDGELSGILGVSHDITDQILVKQDLEIAKEKAEVASTAKSNFLSNMSHEIRTPMNGVIGMAEVLNMTELDQEQKRIVSLIIRSGNNLLNIINDILDFSKIENGKLEIELTPINLKSIVREVVEMMMFSTKEKDVNFHHKIDPNIPEFVIGDSLRIKQILINLVSNAIKFTKVGEVVVEASFLGNTDDVNCIVFKVKDTGIGIGRDEKEFLFEAFTQADASTSRKYGGTGLGLAISSRLVAMMGGKLDVISEKGKGSTFFFDLCFKKVAIVDTDKI